MKNSLVAGSVSGCLVRLCTCPLDVLKIRFQLQLEPIQLAVCSLGSFGSLTYPNYESSQVSKYRGLLDAVRTMLKEEGISVFWKGLFTGQVMYMLYGGVQFYTFDTCKGMVEERFPSLSNSWKNVTNFSVGTVSGGAAAVAAHPLDVIRTRFVGQGQPKIYPSIRRAVVMMYQENGIRCFYRGLVPSLLYTAPQAGLSFGFYRGLTRLWNHTPILQDVPQSVRSLVCGAMAGIGSKTIVLPFDLVKKRLAVQGFEVARKNFGRVTPYNGVVECFVKILREEGPLSFYKGTAPSLLKAAASVSLSFLFYERALQWLRARHSDK